MHEIVKYFILTENQSHCFNRRFVIHSHSRSIRTGAPDACVGRAGDTGSAHFLISISYKDQMHGMRPRWGSAVSTDHTKMVKWPPWGRILHLPYIPPHSPPVPVRRCYGTYCFSGSCTKFTYSCSACQFSYYVFSRGLQQWAEPGPPARPMHLIWSSFLIDRL